MALLFTRSSSQYLYSASAVASRVPMTIMAWYKRSDLSSGMSPVSIGDVNQTTDFQALQTRDYSTGVRAIAFNGVAAAEYVVVADTTTYHHFVGVFTSGRIYCYWDGSLRIDVPWADAAIAIDQIRIGQTVSDTFSDLMNGYIEHVAVWTTALNATEIGNLYSISVSPLDVQSSYLYTYTPLKSNLIDATSTLTWTPVNMPSPSYEDSGINYPASGAVEISGSHSIPGLTQSGELTNYTSYHTILLKRGLKATIPTANIGEPLWTLDTHELFIGTSSGNAQIANQVYVDSHINNLTNPHQTTLQQVTSAGNTTSLQIISTLPAGTAPFQIASSTGVTNLNADLWDGYQFSDFLDQAVRTIDSPSFNRIISTVVTGTAPFTVASSTGVTNLNADLLDGYHASYFQSALTTGNMTASSPIAVDQTRQVIGGAVVISHVATAGNMHLPTGGSLNQLVKNNGTSGTGAWGTVTENAGALAAITTLNMSGQLTNTVSPGTPPFVVSSNTRNVNLNADYLDGYHYADLFPVQESNIFLNDVTTWNASIARHGFLPRLSGNSNQFLDGAGNFSTPSSGTTNDYGSTSFSGQTSVTVNHNFGSFPLVQIVSSTGNVVMIPYTITHSSINSFIVTFTVATSGTILYTLGSPQNQRVITVSDNYAALSTDRVIHITAAGKTITLPAGVVGHEFVVDNGASGDIYVIVTGGGTINSETSQTIPPDAAMHIFALTTTSYRIY